MCFFFLDFTGKRVLFIFVQKTFFFNFLCLCLYQINVNYKRFWIFVVGMNLKFVDINTKKTKRELKQKISIKTRRKNHDDKKDRAVYRAYEDGNGVRRSGG